MQLGTGEEAYIDSIDGPGSPQEYGQNIVPMDAANAGDEGAKRRFAERWLKKIQKSDAARNGWKRKAESALERYTGQKDEATSELSYPLFYSNVQVLHGAMYSATPQPDVRRRFDTGDQAQNMVAMSVERGLSHMVDSTDTNAHFSRGLTDYLVPGLGQVRIQYDADVTEEPVDDPETGQQAFDSNGQPLTIPVIRSQRVWIEHVPWDCFSWDHCMSWIDCQWVAFKHWLTMEDIREQFDVSLDRKDVGETKQKGGKKLYCVFEIWDRQTETIIFLCKGASTPLKVAKDVLGLEGFFPCPNPLMANVSCDSLEPTPDYFFYETQERQIDRLTKRINNLTATSTVLRGMYDATLGEELEQLSQKDDGEFLPVTGLSQKLQQAGGGGDAWSKVIAHWPVEQTAKVIGQLQQQREAELNHVYQITGISDIMRGYSKASETLGAQEIKQSAVSNRLAIRRNLFDQFVRETFRIAADLMAKHYTPETWFYLTGLEIDEQQEGILKGGILLEYSVDIETDSTVAADTDANKKASIEAVEATANALQRLMPMQAQGLPADLIQQMLLTAMRPFKMTRNFEQAVMQLPGTMQQMQMAQQQVEQLTMQNNELQAQLQQALQQIGANDERKQGREDLKVEAEAERDYAQAEKLRSEANTEGTEAIKNLAQANDIARGE